MTETQSMSHADPGSPPTCADAAPTAEGVARKPHPGTNKEEHNLGCTLCMATSFVGSAEHQKQIDESLIPFVWCSQQKAFAPCLCSLGWERGGHPKHKWGWPPMASLQCGG